MDVCNEYVIVETSTNIMLFCPRGRVYKCLNECKKCCYFKGFTNFGHVKCGYTNKVFNELVNRLVILLESEYVSVYCALQKMKSVFHFCEAFFWLAHDGDLQKEEILNPWSGNVGFPPPQASWDNFTPDDADMYPPNYYCILVDGTPTDTGFYQLEIHVEVFIDGGILGIIDAGEQVDDTSLSITVKDATVSIVENTQTFAILGAQPNPFYGQTYIKYYSPYKEEVSLIVYDLLGNKIYDETMISRKGINKFNFTGIKLAKGIYCYSITAHNKTYTKRMIKTN